MALAYFFLKKVCLLPKRPLLVPQPVASEWTEKEEQNAYTLSPRSVATIVMPGECSSAGLNAAEVISAMNHSLDFQFNSFDSCQGERSKETGEREDCRSTVRLDRLMWAGLLLPQNQRGPQK